MKFEFWTEKGKPRAVCCDVGKIDRFEADSDLRDCGLAFWVGGKRYWASSKPFFVRRCGGVFFRCSEGGGVFTLSVPPKSGVLDDWRTPGGAVCSDPRVVRAFILSVALLFRCDKSSSEKDAAEVAAIIGVVPTRAEALEWLKTNRFPTEFAVSYDVGGRLHEGEDAEEFEDYLLSPWRLVKSGVCSLKFSR